ncbi:MAG: hypothetical protein KBC46_03520 [Ferrovibrio sp.]|nr:hypothetical protein [Ferrovibrio sp.]
MSTNDPSLNLIFKRWRENAKGYGVADLFSRATGAQGMTPTGLLQSVAAGVARHSYDPVTLAYQGFLPEAASTQLALDTEDFGGGAWSSSNTSLTANSLAAPNGTVTADTITDTASGAYGYRAQSFTVANDSLAHTASTFFHAGTSTKPGITLLLSGGSSIYVDAAFDLATGTASISGPGTGVARMQYWGAGWWRCLARLLNNSTGNTTLQARVLPAVNAAADVTSVYAWGFNLTKSSTLFSYMPATSGTVTRNADTLTTALTTANFNPLEGTMLFEGLVPETSGVRVPFLLGSNSSSTNYIALYVNGSSAGADVSAGGPSIFNPTLATGLVEGAPICLALAYKAGDFAAIARGGTLLTQASGALPSPSVFNTAYHGSSLAGQHYGAPMLRNQYWPVRFSDADLARLVL